MKALSPETEVWWDSSPLVWPNFVENYEQKLPQGERTWFLEETSGMFLDAPVSNWVFDGCTTNPPLSWAVIQQRQAEWVALIKEIRKSYTGKSRYGLFRKVYFESVRRGAEKLMPLFEASGAKLGHISGQVDPNRMKNEAAMKEMAEELAAQSPNVMVKIPASTSGIPVFRFLASKGIATNATTCFNVPQIMAVAQAVTEGISAHRAAGTERPGWRAVITQMAGRLEDSASFRGYINKMNLDISPLELRVASEAVVKKTARLLRQREQPLKMLHCSARKHHGLNGEVFYPHIDMYAGGPLVYTVPPGAIGDYLYHYRDREIVANWDREPDPAVMEKLMSVPYFVKSMDEEGYAVEQFDEITSLNENATSFCAATNAMIEFVGDFV
ncbi:MAG: transaldolase family protein [Lysobacterales bacterium]